MPFSVRTKHVGDLQREICMHGYTINFVHILAQISIYQ